MLKFKIRDAIIEFNMKINSGYPTADYKSLLMNYLKKALRGYFMYGFIGSIKKSNIHMLLDDNHLVSLRVSYNEVWMAERIQRINDAIDELDLVSLYDPNMILGKFVTSTEKLIFSIKDFKFE